MQSNELIGRLALGAVVVAAVAVAGLKARALTRSGAAAGLAAGTIAVSAGWSWGVLLLGLFVTGSALSRIGEDEKARLLGPVVEKNAGRDARQVVANGAVYAAAAAGMILTHHALWYAIGIGALAASAADTWSTEIGTLSGGAPRLIVSGRTVAAGTSGGLTLAGTLGAIAGAMSAALGAKLAGWPVPIVAVIAGGLAGALGDSLLGATAQSRRWCEECRSGTERMVHTCGCKTIPAGGITGFDNDGVNFVSTVIGGVMSLLAARLIGAA